MHAPAVVARWRARVRDLLPRLHGHTCKALADLSLALLETCHVHAGRLALRLPGVHRARVQPRSAVRRIERLLANPRLRVWDCAAALSAQVWARLDRPGAELLLLLDETPLRNDLRVLKLSVGLEGRALPLQWFCYRGNDLPHALPCLVARLLLGFGRTLPHPRGRVILLADRGLAWPLLLDLCTRLGWDFLLRVQAQTRLRSATLTERPIQALVPHPGTQWYGEAEVFKEAGWRRVQVAARWRRGDPEPWILISSRPATAALFGRYRRRMQQEESFRDEKSSGFQWHKSQVRTPAHADRLLLAIALAMQLALRIGQALRRGPERRLFERRGRRELSLFQLGLRYLSWAAPECLLRRLNLNFFPPPPRPP